MRVKGATASSGLAKRFDGWQLGVVLVLAAWAIVMLLVPRPETPLELPEPLVSPNEVAAMRAREEALVALAESRLSDVSRALGTTIRQLGRAEVKQQSTERAAARNEIVAAVNAIPSDGLEMLLALRALQTATFVRAVREWEATGVASRDLDELGGGLVPAFREAGWCVTEGQRSRILMDDDVLGVAFRKRWNEIVGLKPERSPSALVEEKLLFAFAIRHPRPRRAGDDEAASRALGARTILRRIDEYARLDPTYPADYARGIAHLGGGAYGPAQLAFHRHLVQQPDGPYTLRARNFGRAALVADFEGAP